ncbi:MAG: hypothetical protein AB1304_06290 [Bacteroidota bacterium]
MSKVKFIIIAAMLEKIKQFNFNRLWIGIIIGLLTPFTSFFLYWLFKYYYISFPNRFIWFLKLGDMWEGVVKLCVLTNLIPFYLFLNKNKNRAAAGIIASTMMFVFYIIYLMYFSENE